MDKNDFNILVISHTSFSSTDSMGSTLASYFSSINDEHIYQFFIKEMVPDVFPKAKYYKQTDNDALRHSLFPWKRKYQGREIKCSNTNFTTAIKNEELGGKNILKRYRNLQQE